MLNKIQLIGCIAHDLEKQYINSKNEQITKLDLNLTVNNKNDKNKVQYIPCVAFRQQADNIAKYLSKGSKVFLEGTLLVQRYTTNEGQKRIKNKVIIHDVIFLDKKLKT